MVGMAPAAIRFCNVRPLSMKAPAKLLIVRDVLMAVEAEARLRGFRERLVAIHAVLFELRVAFDESARHHKFLEKTLTPSRPDRRESDECDHR